jgi:hypothetical protein
MNRRTLKIKKIIEKAIKEHNEIWKDICQIGKFPGQNPGCNCFNLTESQIITIASGIDKRVRILL